MAAHRLLADAAAAAAVGTASAKPTAYEARRLRLPAGDPTQRRGRLHPRQHHGRLHRHARRLRVRPGLLRLRVLHPGLLLAPLPDQDRRQDRPRPPHRPLGRLRQGPLLLAQHRRGHPPWRQARVLRRHRLRRLRDRELLRVPHLRLRIRLQPPAHAPEPGGSHRQCQASPARCVLELRICRFSGTCCCELLGLVVMYVLVFMLIKWGGRKDPSF
ncbi:hypothetical protein BS78_09G108600 [Paspalum vaginatum]|nr:hypothetical protein BS78_09G108600 [Paspalum vaginatum]